MPENEEKPQDRQTAAPKKPGGRSKDRANDPASQPGSKSAGREARLAEALRANLRRRKAGGEASDKKDT